MTPRRASLAAIPFLGLIAGPVAPAHADAIDGHWCDDGKRHLHISGPAIVTPSGVSMRGDYDRHGFRYVEPSDGRPVVMVLMGETRMRLTAGDGAPETWHRCAAPIS